MNFDVFPKSSHRALDLDSLSISVGDDQNLHRCVAAYLSDLTLLRTAVTVDKSFKLGMMVSLDHAMWFHTSFRTDQWMLYECESPRAGTAFLTFLFLLHCNFDLYSRYTWRKINTQYINHCCKQKVLILFYVDAYSGLKTNIRMYTDTACVLIYCRITIRRIPL